MLPEDLLLYRICGDAAVPLLLREDDHPLLRPLLAEYDRCVGRPYRELAERLARPLQAGHMGRQRLAIHVLDHLLRPAGKLPIPPGRVRAAVFLEAARAGPDRARVLAAVAPAFAATPEALWDALFSDLPAERLVAALRAPLSPGELALHCNLALWQGLLFRAAAVRIEVLGNARALYRHARLRGLLCTVTAPAGSKGAVLELSGPYALFRRTLLYGRALAQLVPLLPWCDRFQLSAECVLRGRRLLLELGPGEPMFPSTAPRAYDSRLEERFARDFRRAAPRWDLHREPEPVAAGGTLIFPDFALIHREQPERRWLLEIVGFWTPEYVRRKLALYRSARLGRLILCIDADRNCAAAELPEGVPVLRFRRRVDAEAVRRIIEAPGPRGGP